VGVSLTLLRSENNSVIKYLPHGVTTLALGIQNGDDQSHDLIVRPTNRSNPPEYVAYESTKNLVDAHSKDLNIIWGGGMTSGFRINLEPLKTTNVFYLISHNSKMLDNYSFTLEAIDIVDGIEENVLSTKVVNLVTASHSTDCIRYEVNYDSPSQRTGFFQGKYVPDYLSRWFGSDYTYSKISLPSLEVNYKEVAGERYVDSEVDIFMKMPSTGEKNKIANVSGDLERCKFSAELFNFTAEYFIMRIWFFWTNAKFQGNFIMSAPRHRTRQAIQLRSWKSRVIEVPDSERFDLMISKTTGKIAYVGTDLHWRETWWATAANQVCLRFAGMELTPVLIKNLPHLLEQQFKVSKQKKPPNYDPAQVLRLKLISMEKPKGNEKFQVTEKTRKYDSRGNVMLGHGLHRKHVPYILDFNLMPEFVSHPLTDL
jgi:hypothetical protein